EALDFIQTYYHLPHITWEGIYTHFSHADEGDWSTTEKQFALFKQTVTSLEKRGYVFPIQHVGGSTIAMERADMHLDMVRDRKSTRLNSSHVSISYAVFCLKKKIKV